MRNVICYETKRGTTKQYMVWLAEEIDAELKTFDDVSEKEDFADYDNVIVSSGTYMGHMPLVDFLEKHWKHLASKKVTAVAVGAAPADDSWSVLSYERIAPHIREKITYVKIMGENPETLGKTGHESQVKKENLASIIELIK